jgi:hypothetical protein
MMPKSLIVAACLTFTGCLGGAYNPGTGGEGEGSFPTNHQITSNNVQNPNAGAVFGLSFNLPKQATVSFDITDNGSADTWFVGIVTSTDFTTLQGGQSVSSFLGHDQVSTVSDSGSVPAGNYDFAVKCENVIESCPLTFNLSADF